MENSNLFNTPDHTDEYDYNEVQNDNIVVLALTYILFFLPYIFLPNSRYAKFNTMLNTNNRTCNSKYNIYTN